MQFFEQIENAIREILVQKEVSFEIYDLVDMIHESYIRANPPTVPTDAAPNADFARPELREEFKALDPGEVKITAPRVNEPSSVKPKKTELGKKEAELR